MRSRFGTAASSALLLQLVLTLHAAAQARPEDAAIHDRPTILRDEGYVGPDSCVECHAENHASWSASYHRRMTQIATTSAVLAPFEGKTPVLEGTAWELAREGETHFVTPLSASGDGTTWERGERREVVLTTGSHHYQIYWLAARPGFGMEQLPLVWHLGEKRWVPRKSLFLAPPVADSGHETGRWETSCIKCHATNGTEEHPSGGTRAADFGIACEACHGPAERHVDWHRGPGRGANDAPAEAQLVVPSELPKERSVDVCGQCHAIRPLATAEERRDWAAHGFAFRPGGALEPERPLLSGRYEDNAPALRELVDRTPGLLDEFFWSDGEVRVSGREVNGLVESACYRRGAMTCVSCHEMHPGKQDPRPLSSWADDQLKPGKDGQDACLSCHTELAAPERAREHSHHAPGGSAPSCLDCHMPYTTYGLTKAMRSHRISSPDAAVELATGRPSACTLCHLDRPLGWTADRLTEWTGRARPELERDRSEVAASILYALEGDAGQRALMAWAYGWAPAREVSGTGWMPFVLSTLAMDPYDAVRWIAVQTIRRDGRHADFTLDFTEEIEAQRNHVRESVLAEWLRDGLDAPPERRAALLVRPDRTLDEARFRALYARRDLGEVRLSE